MEVTEVKLEVAFEGSFFDDPADLTWTDVTARLTVTGGPVLSARVGRNAVLSAAPQSAVFAVRLDSEDGALTPDNPDSVYFPNVVAGVPVRVQAKDSDDAWQPVYYGFAESWNPTYLNASGHPDWSEVTLTCSDGLARLNQAGTRLTYRDRVLTDLSGARGLAWTLTGLVEERTSTGRQSPPSGLVANDWQRFGLAWFTLSDSGRVAWDQPGAGGVIGESGSGDHFPFVVYSDSVSSPSSWNAILAGFEGDRAGGTWVWDGSALTVSAALDDAYGDQFNATPASGGGGNFLRHSVYAGRPPDNLLPADAIAGGVSGWTASGGSLVQVDADSVAWTTRRESWDLSTGVRSTVIVGPSTMLEWTGYSLSDELVSDVAPVTAGEWYAAHVSFDASSSPSMGLIVRWVDSGGAKISDASLTGSRVARVDGNHAILAPTGAVGAVLVAKPGSGSTTGAYLRLHAPGIYLGLPTLTNRLDDTRPVRGLPSRWWPRDASADLRLWVMCPLNPTAAANLGVTTTDTLWVTGEVVVPWAAGETHSVEWNLHPGVDAHPVLWVDGVDVTATTSWSLSYPGVDIGHDNPESTLQASFSAGVGFSTYQTPLQALQPSAITTLYTLVGVEAWKTAPDADLVEGHYALYGAPGTIELTSLLHEPTDQVITSLLDSLPWPVGQRDIATGRSTADLDWVDGADLNTYADALAAAVGFEYGWTDVGPDGKFRWLPRRWYEDALSGAAVADAYYTWRTTITGAITYSLGIDPRYEDDDVYSKITVHTTASPDDAQAIDYAVRRRTPRELVVSGGWLTQTEVDEVRDILAAQHKPGIRLDALTLTATGADDAVLDEILARRAGDVVLVGLPMSGDDLILPLLVQSIQHDTDGVRWRATMGLARCPVPARLSTPDRVNYCAYPSFENAATTGWALTGSATITAPTDQAHSDTYSLKVVTTGTAALEGAFYSPVAQADFTAGDAFSVGAWVYAPLGASMRLDAGSLGAGAVAGTTAFTGTGEWQWVAVDGATVGASLNPYLLVRTATAQAITYYVDDGLIVSGATAGDGFTGSTTDTDDWHYAWSGTADASISYAYRLYS